MAYEKNICGECAHFSDTGICRIPMVKNSYRSFFTAACVWFETRKNNAEMETYKVNGKKEAQPEKKAAAQPEGPKACAECGRILPLEKFHKNRWGYTKICKECNAKKVSKTLKEGPKEDHSCDKLNESELYNEKEKKEIIPNAQYSPQIVQDVLAKVADQELANELTRRGYRGHLVREVSMNLG